MLTLVAMKTIDDLSESRSFPFFYLWLIEQMCLEIIANRYVGLDVKYTLKLKVFSEEWRERETVL